MLRFIQILSQIIFILRFLLEFFTHSVELAFRGIEFVDFWPESALLDRLLFPLLLVDGRLESFYRRLKSQLG